MAILHNKWYPPALYSLNHYWGLSTDYMYHGLSMDFPWTIHDILRPMSSSYPISLVKAKEAWYIRPASNAFLTAGLDLLEPPPYYIHVRRQNLRP